MAIYTVHEPPLKRYQASPDPQRFIFVRDGFSIWAFLLTPLWMLRHRMWAVLACYVVAGAILHLLLQAAHASTLVQFAVGTLVALLAGFEAGTLRRFTLGRRKFRNLGIVVGDDLEMAEQRFFNSWVKGEREEPPPSPAPMTHRPAPATDVIGLFPEPGGAPR